MKKIYLMLLILIIGSGAVYYNKSVKKSRKDSETAKVNSNIGNNNSLQHGKKIRDNDFAVYMPDLSTEQIKMYWKDENNKPYSELAGFISGNSQSRINFATNGGIYSSEYEPQGLYIENYKIISKIDTRDGEGNFYMKPNGIFYIQDKQPKISATEKFDYKENISYAVQSGPMLIENNIINKKLGKNSKSLKIRSAVGIDRENRVFFLLSSKDISFYDFAKYALDKLNCRDLLFLDGTISEMYFADEKKLPVQKYPFVVIISSESIEK